MKNKKLIIILIILLVLFVLAKTCYLPVIYKLYNAVDKFRDEDNRYYMVSQSISENISFVEEIYVKEKLIKYVGNDGKSNVWYEWKNLETNEQYSFGNKVLVNDTSIKKEDFMKNLPNLVSIISKGNKFNFSAVMKIRYIFPIKYNDKMCYKIVTKSETIIIDSDTYLPVYSSIIIRNSSEENKNKNEKTYEFKVGTVKDEDFELPDFTDYTIIEKVE